LCWWCWDSLPVFSWLNERKWVLTNKGKGEMSFGDNSRFLQWYGDTV